MSVVFHDHIDPADDAVCITVSRYRDYYRAEFEMVASEPAADLSS